jgi:hypothetical protein
VLPISKDEINTQESSTNQQPQLGFLCIILRSYKWARNQVFFENKLFDPICYGAWIPTRTSDTTQIRTHRHYYCKIKNIGHQYRYIFIKKSKMKINWVTISTDAANVAYCLNSTICIAAIYDSIILDFKFLMTQLVCQSH